MGIIKNKKLLINLLAGVIIYFIAIVIFRNLNLSAASVQYYSKSFGLIGYISLFLVQLFFSLTPVPDSPVAILGIVLYGSITGSIIIYLAMFAGAVCHYYFAKSLGKNFILKHFPELELYTKDKGKWNTFVELVLIRNFALVSFDVSAYVAGISNISFRLFAVSTLVGLLPVLIGNIILAQGILTKTWLQAFFILLAYIGYISIIFFSHRKFKKYNL